MTHSRRSILGRIVVLTCHQESTVKVGAMLVASVAMLIMAGCVGMESRQPLPTAPSVDLTRYIGTWYEIARLPMWFQRHCIDSKAIYTILPDSKIGVHNECVTDSGTLDQADGVATVVDPTTNARLAVTFNNFFARLVSPSREGNYWIIDLDLDYRIAMVGTPDRRYLWILSRRPHIDDLTYQRLVAKAQALGFPISELIKVKRSLDIPTSCGSHPTEHAIRMTAL
jgi:apolipoprotein D and lipocalin family protein